MKWTCADGRRIPIDQLEADHLGNILNRLDQYPPNMKRDQWIAILRNEVRERIGRKKGLEMKYNKLKRSQSKLLYNALVTVAMRLNRTNHQPAQDAVDASKELSTLANRYLVAAEPVPEKVTPLPLPTPTEIAEWKRKAREAFHSVFVDMTLEAQHRRLKEMVQADTSLIHEQWVQDWMEANHRYLVEKSDGFTKPRVNKHGNQYKPEWATTNYNGGDKAHKGTPRSAKQLEADKRRGATLKARHEAKLIAAGQYKPVGPWDDPEREAARREAGRLGGLKAQANKRAKAEAAARGELPPEVIPLDETDRVKAKTLRRVSKMLSKGPKGRLAKRRAKSRGN